MTRPSGERRGGPPKAAVLVGVAALVVLLLVAATRTPPAAAPEPPNGPAAEVVASGSAPAQPASGAPERSGAPAPLSGGTSHAPAGSVPGGPSVSTPPAPAAAGSSATMDSDLPPDHPPITEDDSPQVSLQWLGAYCFYIHSPGGTAVVTDPFDPKVARLPAPATGAHLVTVSERSPWHSFTSAVHAFQGDSKEVLFGEERRRGDVRVTPIRLEGQGTAYVIDAGGMRIAHLGGLGRALSAADARAFGKLDILLLPAGAPELSPAEAARTAQALAPRVVIPMAFTPTTLSGESGALRSIEAFVAATSYAVTKKDSDILLLSARDLPTTTEIWVLQLRRS